MTARTDAPPEDQLPTEEGRYGLPRTLLDPEHTKVLEFTGENYGEIEAELGDWVRLTQDGPQVRVLIGEDLADGWQPLHNHHTVVLFDESAHPFTLTPAAARALGLRDD